MPRVIVRLAAVLDPSAVGRSRRGSTGRKSKSQRRRTTCWKMCAQLLGLKDNTAYRRKRTAGPLFGQGTLRGRFVLHQTSGTIAVLFVIKRLRQLQRPQSKDRAGRGTPFSTPTPVPKSLKWADCKEKDTVRCGGWKKRLLSLGVPKSV
jgi:hypothetical protein